MDIQYLKIIQRICTEISHILPIDITLRKTIAEKLYKKHITNGDIDPKSIVTENREDIIKQIIDHFVKNPRKFRRSATYENRVSYYLPQTNRLVVAHILTNDPMEKEDNFNGQASGIAEALALTDDMNSEAVKRAVIYLQSKINVNIVVESFKSYLIPRGKIVSFTDGLIVAEMAEGADESLCEKLANAIYKNENLNTREAIQKKLNKIQPDAQVDNVIKKVFMLKNDKEISFNVC